MGSSAHRRQVAQRRKREREETRARQTQAAQRAAAAQADWHLSRRRQSIAWSLIGAGGVVGLSHLLQHIGLYELMSPGMSDIFIGYPTAFVLVIFGVMRVARTA